MPPPLPGARCALTAPFQPCPPPRGGVGGLLSVALSLGSHPPGVTRHPRFRGARTFLERPLRGARAEKQLLRYVRDARRIKGSTGEALLQLLEMRLDNIVFRLGMAPTIPAARQLVNHGHICVDGKRLSIPSYQCQAGQTISVRINPRSKQLVEAYLAFPGLANIPSHLEFDKNALKGKINGIIERDWVALQLNELLIVEYYSRKG